MSRHQGIFLKLIRHFEVSSFDSGCIYNMSQSGFPELEGMHEKGEAAGYVGSTIDRCMYVPSRPYGSSGDYVQSVHAYGHDDGSHGLWIDW
jgi:hypothetical protein